MAEDAARILLVEDEPALRSAVGRRLGDAGYAVKAMADGQHLADIVGEWRPDLVILDVMLPGKDGFRLARDLKTMSPCPVIFMTARDDISDRLKGFDVGADDYIVKPFILEELLARVTAVLRRSGRLTSSVVELGDLTLDEQAGDARRNGQSLGLTATEMRLLAYLVRNRGRAVSKTQILTQVWGYGEYDPNLAEVHTSSLRKKLEAHGPRIIHTVRNVGYVLRPNLAEYEAATEADPDPNGRTT